MHKRERLAHPLKIIHGNDFTELQLMHIKPKQWKETIYPTFTHSNNQLHCGLNYSKKGYQHQSKLTVLH